MDIPKLKFPRDKIIEIIPAAYQNKAKRIDIIGLDPRTIPGSPEDIRIPVANDSSANLPPIPGMSSPGPLELVVPRPPEEIVDNSVADKVADED
jgi:6-phosphofructo-2-kinase/fructose-2,6-biphosphatase 4